MLLLLGGISSQHLSLAHYIALQARDVPPAEKTGISASIFELPLSTKLSRDLKIFGLAPSFYKKFDEVRIPRSLQVTPEDAVFAKALLAYSMSHTNSAEPVAQALVARAAASTSSQILSATSPSMIASNIGSALSGSSSSCSRRQDSPLKRQYRSDPDTGICSHYTGKGSHKKSRTSKTLGMRKIGLENTLALTQGTAGFSESLNAIELRILRMFATRLVGGDGSDSALAGIDLKKFDFRSLCSIWSVFVAALINDRDADVTDYARYLFSRTEKQLKEALTKEVQVAQFAAIDFRSANTGNRMDKIWATLSERAAIFLQFRVGEAQVQEPVNAQVAFVQEQREVTTTTTKVMAVSPARPQRAVQPPNVLTLDFSPDRSQCVPNSRPVPWLEFLNIVETCKFESRIDWTGGVFKMLEREYGTRKGRSCAVEKEIRECLAGGAQAQSGDGTRVRCPSSPCCNSRGRSKFCCNFRGRSKSMLQLPWPFQVLLQLPWPFQVLLQLAWPFQVLLQLAWPFETAITATLALQEARVSTKLVPANVN